MDQTGGLEIYELPFYYLGLNTVAKRLVGVSAATGALLFYIKPDTFFDPETEKARPWKLVSNDPVQLLSHGG